jgi:hypothetical protein
MVAGLLALSSQLGGPTTSTQTAGAAATVSRTAVGHGALPAGLAHAIAGALPAVTSWGQLAELTATGGANADAFGISVATSGNAAVVGAYNKNSATGAAYVFVHSGTTWSQQARLMAGDGAAGDQFGYSVAISGTTIVVGAPGKSSGTGAAYVFVHSGTAWSQQARLTAGDGVAGD